MPRRNDKVNRWLRFHFEKLVSENPPSPSSSRTASVRSSRRLSYDSATLVRHVHPDDKLEQYHAGPSSAPGLVVETDIAPVHLAEDESPVDESARGLYICMSLPKKQRKVKENWEWSLICADRSQLDLQDIVQYYMEDANPRENFGYRSIRPVPTPGFRLVTEILDTGFTPNQIALIDLALIYELLAHDKIANILAKVRVDLVAPHPTYDWVKEGMAALVDAGLVRKRRPRHLWAADDLSLWQEISKMGVMYATHVGEKRMEADRKKRLWTNGPRKSAAANMTERRTQISTMVLGSGDIDMLEEEEDEERQTFREVVVDVARHVLFGHRTRN